MSWKRHQQPPTDRNLCKRCHNAEHTIVVRNHPYCEECFCKYVQLKMLKRMDSFRVLDAKTPTKNRKILLALSLGSCSVALLHLLDIQLKSQLAKTGRTGYELHVLHVDDRSQDISSEWASVRSRFPDHHYESVALADCITTEGTLSLFPGVIQTDTTVENLDEAARFEIFHRLLDSLPSPTARSDATRILMQRLLVQTAKTHGCEAIFWGDSTTKLAERTLAETAKGRGFSTPWVIAEGESPQGKQIPYHHPLRDLLTSEIVAYVSYIQPSVAACILSPPSEHSKPAVSTKNTTIDELMRQYFKSVEREYPSIVANVVKTTGKLQPRGPLGEMAQRCELCEMQLDARNSPEKSRLCHGCIRTLPSAT